MRIEEIRERLRATLDPIGGSVESVKVTKRGIVKVRVQLPTVIMTVTSDSHEKVVDVIRRALAPTEKRTELLDALDQWAIVPPSRPYEPEAS